MEGWDITGDVFAAFFGAVNEGMEIFWEQNSNLSSSLCIVF